MTISLTPFPAIRSGLSPRFAAIPAETVVDNEPPVAMVAKVLPVASSVMPELGVEQLIIVVPRSRASDVRRQLPVLQDMRQDYGAKAVEILEAALGNHLVPWRQYPAKALQLAGL